MHPIGGLVGKPFTNNFKKTFDEEVNLYENSRWIPAGFQPESGWNIAESSKFRVD